MSRFTALRCRDPISHFFRSAAHFSLAGCAVFAVQDSTTAIDHWIWRTPFADSKSTEAFDHERSRVGRRLVVENLLSARKKEPMGQLSNGRDMSNSDTESSLPKHMILRIAAATLLVVAVRVAATLVMTGGCTAADGELGRADGHGAAATATATVASTGAASEGARDAAKEAAADPLESASAAVQRRAGQPASGEPVAGLHRPQDGH